MDAVYKFIKELNINNESVIVAVSGGPDSMLLLHILICLRQKLNLNIIVAHVHHNLRKESDLEAIEVEKYCKENKVIFEMKKIENYPNNKFSEESARKLRYDFFDKLIEKYKSKILFTAHHGDDLIETILMRISRGSSLKGYAGIKEISNDRGYIIARPLIFMTKSQIEYYIKKNNIYCVYDMSNYNDKYTRNRYRNHILPILKQENKDVHLKYNEFSKKILLADIYIRKQADLEYQKIVSNKIINVKSFNKLEDIMKIYILEKYLKEIYKSNIVLINDSHINIIIEALISHNNLSMDLPDNKKGILEYGSFKIINFNNVEAYEYMFTDKIVLPDNSKIEIDNTTNITSNFVIHLNSEEIKLPFHVRSRKIGDCMYVKNMAGSKKVSDIFTDSKVLKEKRSTYPIVTDDTGKIIWIPGIKKSNLDRKKEEKYDIILKYTLKEE